MWQKAVLFKVCGTCKKYVRCTSNDYWVEKKNAEKRDGITFYEVSDDFEKN